MVKIKDLKASQGELDIDKVVRLIKSDIKILDEKPIIISNDNFVMDGHHRFAAMYIINISKVSCIRIDLPIQELITMTRNFDKVFYKELHELYK